jgi:hypothetical protein
MVIARDFRVIDVWLHDEVCVLFLKHLQIATEPSFSVYKIRKRSKETLLKKRIRWAISVVGVFVDTNKKAAASSSLAV